MQCILTHGTSRAPYLRKMFSRDHAKSCRYRLEEHGKQGRRTDNPRQFVPETRAALNQCNPIPRVHKPYRYEECWSEVLEVIRHNLLRRYRGMLQNTRTLSTSSKNKQLSEGESFRGSTHPIFPPSSPIPPSADMCSVPLFYTNIPRPYLHSHLLSSTFFSLGESALPRRTTSFVSSRGHYYPTPDEIRILRRHTKNFHSLAVVLANLLPFSGLIR